MLGVIGHPDGALDDPAGRNLVMDLSERLARFRNLFHDRPGQFAASFDAVLADGGIKVADPAPLPAGEPAHIACA